MLTLADTLFSGLSGVGWGGGGVGGWGGVGGMSTFADTSLRLLVTHDRTLAEDVVLYSGSELSPG